MRKGLKLLRVQHELTQEQTAKKLGYSREHYRQIENGERDYTLRFLEAVKREFNLSHDKAVETLKKAK